MRHTLRTAFAIVLTTIAVQSHAVPDEGNGKPEHKAATELASPGDVADALVHVDISYEEVRRIIVAEQKTGYRPLPPGIAKNVARGKPLPPGIAKKKVPTTIVRHLPTY